MPGSAFLGIGSDAPPPSGPEDGDFKAAMLKEAEAPMFQWRVNFWSRLTGRGAFDWVEFRHRLEESEFRNYVSVGEAAKSLGYADLTQDGNRWLFAVAKYKTPIFGPCAMRHELFHAAQDFKTQLFQKLKLRRKSRLLRYLVAEFSAHLFGGPLIGVPVCLLPVGFVIFFLWSLSKLVIYFLTK